MMVPVDGRVFLSPLNVFTWKKYKSATWYRFSSCVLVFFFFFGNFIDPLNSTVWELLLDALLLGSGLNLCQKKQCNACTRPFIGHWWREASGLGSLWLRNAAFPEFGHRSSHQQGAISWTMAQISEGGLATKVWGWGGGGGVGGTPVST